MWSKCLFLTVVLFGMVAGAREVQLNHIEVQNCETFPYYGYENAEQKVFRDYLAEGVRGLHQCLSSSRSHHYAKEKLTNLVDILEGKMQKTFKCTYGEYNSFTAVATLPPNMDEPVMAVRDLPPYPGVLFDTNRMSGNFPVILDETLVNNIYNFYGGSLDRSLIVPGSRNPYFTRANNPASLIAHEMLHWTGEIHKRSQLDFVYLSQVCCFPIEGVEIRVQEQACSVLFDEKAWQENKESRDAYIQENRLLDLNQSIIEAYQNQ